MAIRFEYGPPQSALGALAYQAGAAEAADRRRREIEQMQMQAAQMRQQQQQNALNRQFDAWKTQYSHHSALDKMQKDFKWREEQSEIGRDHEKRMFGLKNERGDFEWERQAEEMRERQELAWEEQRRQSEENDDRMRERALHEAKIRRDETEINRLQKEKDSSFQRKYARLDPSVQAEVDKHKDKINRMQTDKRIKPPHLNGQQISEIDDHIKREEAEIEKLFQDKKNWKNNEHMPNRRWKRGITLYQNDEHGTPRMLGQDPSATYESAKRAMNITGVKRQDEEGRTYVLDAEMEWDPKLNQAVWKPVRNYPEGKTSKERSESLRDRAKARKSAYDDLFVKPDDLTPAGTLSPLGVAMARQFNIPVGEGNVIAPDQYNTFVEKYLSHTGYSAPEDDDQAALGGQGRPFSYESTPVVGEWATGDDPVQGAAARAEEGNATGQDAMVLDAQLQQQKELDDRVSRDAEDMRGVYKHDDPDRPDYFNLGAELTPEGYKMDDPLIDESERQRRQKAYSEALTRQGRGRETGPFSHIEPGAYEARHDPDVTKRPKGWPVNRTPEVGAEALEKVLGKVEESTAGKALDTSSKKTRSSLAALSRAVRETSGKGPSVGVRSNKKDPKSKYQKDRAAAKRKKTYEVMKKGTPGERVPMPKVYSSISGRYDPVGPKNITRANRDEYNKFQKELRNYTHRLLNNKDASKDAKIRLDRIATDLPKMSDAELADEIRVLKVLGRSANIKDPSFFDKNPVWKDFVSGKQTNLDKVLGRFGITMTPQGRPKWTAKSARHSGLAVFRELHESLKKAGF